MNNKNISPLYIYTKQAIESGRANVRFLQKAKISVDAAIDTCCYPRHKVSVNAFLNTFYTLLNGMPRKFNLHKLEAVSIILGNKIDCCTAETIS